MSSFRKIDDTTSRGRSSQFLSPESMTDFEFVNDGDGDGDANDSIEELGFKNCGGDGHISQN